jgi:hypothetical protein
MDFRFFFNFTRAVGLFGFFFLYGIAHFIVGGDFLAMNKTVLKLNQVIHEMWLFVILCLFFALLRIHGNKNFIRTKHRDRMFNFQRK